MSEHYMHLASFLGHSFFVFFRSDPQLCHQKVSDPIWDGDAARTMWPRLWPNVFCFVIPLICAVMAIYQL